MSYYATYEGNIVFNENFKKNYSKNKRIVEEAFKEGFSETFDFVEREDGSFTVFLAGGINYNEDSIHECYKILIPFVHFAEIEFVGEGTALWKHTFENGTWNEYDGSIIYSDEPNKTLNFISEAS